MEQNNKLKLLEFASYKSINYLVLLIIFFIIGFQKASISQSSCSNPVQLCYSTNSVITFPAATSGIAQGGPAYGCLGAQPAPTWFYFKTNATLTSTVTQFVFSSSNNSDIDAIIWGPLSAPTGFCSSITNSASIVGCSYSASATETLTITNTIPNQYYLIMTTNYSGTVNNSMISCNQGIGNISCPATLPIANFSFPTSTVCKGQPIGLTDMSSPLGSILAWNYQCATSVPSSSTLKNPTFTFNTNGIHTVSLTVNSSSGNSTVATKTIQVNTCSSPTITINTTSVTCNSQCNGSATVTATGNPPFTYSWSPSGSTGSVVSGLCAGVYSCVVTNSIGGSTTKTITINQPSPLVISTTPPNPAICVGNTIVLTSSISGGTPIYNYSWNTGSTASNAAVTPTLMPVTNYVLTVIDVNSCIATKTIAVNVYPLPLLTVTPANQTLCAGKTATVNISGAAVYNSNPGNITTSSFTVNPSTATIYTVSGTSSFGCQTSTLTTVNVVNTPIVSITSPSTSVCMGYTMAVVANGASSYTWSNGATTNTTNLQPFTNITYSVIGSNGGNCKDTAFLNIVVKPLPNVLASASTTLACAGQSINLTGSGNAANYLWQPNSLLGANQVVQISSPTTYTVYGQGTNGCAFLSTVFVNVQNGNAVIPVVTPSAVCIGDTAILSVIGGTIPSWTANIIPNTNFVTPITATNYTLSATDFNGCVSDVVFTVEINSDCDVLVYNAFTPNGDGINDFFIIDNIDKYPHSNVYIYNRWGNKVFNTTGYNNQTNNWDGKVNGKAVTAGTYFYTITNDKNKLLKKGWIEITN